MASNFFVSCLVSGFNGFNTPHNTTALRTPTCTGILIGSCSVQSLDSIARQYKAQAYTIVASQKVIDVLLDEEASSLADLQEFIDRPVSLQADPYYQQQQYDIALA